MKIGFADKKKTTEVVSVRPLFGSLKGNMPSPSMEMAHINGSSAPKKNWTEPDPCVMAKYTVSQPPKTEVKPIGKVVTRKESKKQREVRLSRLLTSTKQETPTMAKATQTPATQPIQSNGTDVKEITDGTGQRYMIIDGVLYPVRQVPEVQPTAPTQKATHVITNVTSTSPTGKLNPDDFVIRYITKFRGRTWTPSKGKNAGKPTVSNGCMTTMKNRIGETSYDSLNSTLKSYYGWDVKQIVSHTSSMIERGLIKGHPVKGGFMIYLPSDYERVENGGPTVGTDATVAFITG